MVDTAVLTREQADLLTTLVEAQRKVGPDYTEGFRASTSHGLEHLSLSHRGLPEYILDVEGDDVFALARAGLVTVLKSGFTPIIRIDLTPDGFSAAAESE